LSEHPVRFTPGAGHTPDDIATMLGIFAALQTR
jgi:hypothetical protein